MMKCIKKIDLQTRSGTSSKRLSTCTHYENLLFLRDNVSNKETDSNLIPHRISENRQPVEDTPTSPVSPLSPTSTPKGTGKRKRSDDVRSFIEESKERRLKMDSLIAKLISTPSEEKESNTEDFSVRVWLPCTKIG